MSEVLLVRVRTGKLPLLQSSKKSGGFLKRRVHLSLNGRHREAWGTAEEVFPIEKLVERDTVALRQCIGGRGMGPWIEELAGVGRWGGQEIGSGRRGRVGDGESADRETQKARHGNGSQGLLHEPFSSDTDIPE